MITWDGCCCGVEKTPLHLQPILSQCITILRCKAVRAIIYVPIGMLKIIPPASRAICHVFVRSCQRPSSGKFELKRYASYDTPNEYDEAIYYEKNGFYVDDGLNSVKTSERAIDSLTKARE